MEDIAELLAIRAHEKGLELVCQVMPDVPAGLVGDPTRLRQIFVNLIGNAIKFTERGEVVVRVENDPAPDGPRGLRVSVADTGIGIAAGEAGGDLRELHPGGRRPPPDGTEAPDWASTISRRLVGLMGGRMWVREHGGPREHVLLHRPLGCPRRPSAAPAQCVVDPPRAASPHHRR